MMGDLGWISLRARRDILRLIFWGKLTKLGSERLTKRVYVQRKHDFVSSRSSNNWCYLLHLQIARGFAYVEFLE